MSEFINRSEEDVYLAIMDKLGVKVIPSVPEVDDILTNTDWADQCH